MKSHRELCRIAAAWLLNQRWCHVAGYEVRGGGGVLDAVGVSCPLDTEAGDAVRAETERIKRHHREAVARWVDGGHKGKRPGLNQRWAIEPDRKGRTRIVAIEVKRTRSDLLADLRAGKMLRYEHDGSRCYLAIAEGALPDLSELAERGLPKHWGVLCFHEWGDTTHCSVLRHAKPHRTVSVGEVRMWTYRIGKSLAYRVTSDGPVADEAAA